MQSGIQKLKLLTEDLISYFGVQPSGKEAAVDLNHALKIAAKGLRNNITSTNATYISDKLPVLFGYADLLILLFYNLLGNAIKLRSPDKKPFIKINYSLVEETSIGHIHATTNLMYHHISFNNNGIGFNPEYAAEIFDLFFALNEKGIYKGSGLAIPICKKIMEIHKGFITAEKPEEGATFNCYFPVSNTHPG
jgi:light-regulated signal transduction histidine kinase (bacteriophytochrome)